MRIALAQTNPIIGDIAGNTAAIRQAIDRARGESAQLVIFPELSVIGYPPRDLLLAPDVIDACTGAVTDLAAECRDIAAVIGYPCPSEAATGPSLYNAAALCVDGCVAHRHVKTLLPTYDVFDEQRYFGPSGDDPEPFEFDGVPFGLTICEDLWNQKHLVPRQLYHEEPVRQLAEAGARALINCSASPFVADKHAWRIELASAAAKRHRMPVIYCNQVGGNDELIFDGNSFVVDAKGRLAAHAKDFQTDLLIVDLPLRRGSDGSGATGRIETPRDGVAAVYYGLVLGLRDYCRKCGFESIVVGLSGGIDSAVTCALCAAAIGADHVRGVSMPSRYSSDGSKTDASDLAGRLGVRLHTVPIGSPHNALDDLLRDHYEGRSPDVTEENVQARIRGVILMALSNKFGSLLVTTGNKSELAVGYCTLYGDMCGGLAVLSDVPKTMVWDMARWINDSADSPLRQEAGGPVIPDSSISKPPSAELRPDQVDQDSLPPYEQLDVIVERYVERAEPVDVIVAATGIDPDVVHRVVKLIDRNEYKRQQAAPGLKVTGRAFGVGRRMPIAHRRTGKGPGTRRSDAAT